MKRFLKLQYLPLAVLGCGVIAALLRALLWIAAIGDNTSSLLPAGTWPDVLCWITVALTIALLAVSARKIRNNKKYTSNFSASPIGAIAMVLAAVGFLFTSITDLSVSADPITTAATVMGFVAVAALLLLAYFRYKGLRPTMLLHSVVCVYLMLYLVSHYRLWSAAPQLQTYAFELLAIVFVMMACYHRAAFDMNQGSRQAYTFFTLAALFFCIATLPSCDNPAFFIGCGTWMFFTPCKLHQKES